MSPPPPSVSIVVPVYNTGKFLLEAIQSILNQTTIPDFSPVLPSFEIIVVNDRSTDPITLEILKSITNKYQCVKIIDNQRAKGAAGARNMGIQAARGGWLAFLDADDILLPHSLAMRWELKRQNPAALWICCHFKVLQPQKDFSVANAYPPLSELATAYPLTSKPTSSRRHNPIAELCQSCFIPIMGVLIERNLVIQQGMFDEALARAEDYKLWLKCAFYNDLYFSDQISAYYRIHANSLTHGHSPKFLHEELMLDSLLRGSINPDHKRLLRQRFDIVFDDRCNFHRRNHEFESARAASFEWIKRRPLCRTAYKQLVAALIRRD